MNKRGRPKGSKNKSKLSDEALEIKQENNLITNPKEIKKEIRNLRRLKLQCRAGTTERLDLEHKIKDLKKQLTDQTTLDPNKEKLIQEILELEPEFKALEINLNKFSEPELKKHIEIVKRKREI